MKQKFKQLDILETIYNLAEDCKLKSIVFELLDEELSYLSELFSTEKRETFFIANIFCLNLESKWIEIDDLRDLGFIINTDLRFKCNSQLMKTVVKNKKSNFEQESKAENEWSIYLTIIMEISQ